MKENEVLTIEKLKAMKPDVIFATGILPDNEKGINMSGSNENLRWIAVRGDIHDWAIYCHYAKETSVWIKAYGDKVCKKSNIKRCILCDEEALKMYRY